MSNEKKVLSIISFVLSILSILMVIPTRWIIAFIFRNYSLQIFSGAIGTIFGIAAVFIAHSNKDGKSKSKLSAAANVIGYIGIILCVLFMTIDFMFKIQHDDEDLFNNYNSVHNKYDEETISKYISLKKSACGGNYKDISYTKLSRNPDDYESECIHFKGEVIQVLENFDYKQAQLRVNTKLSDYSYIENSYYDDTIYVYVYNYSRNNRILENDIIDLYGIYDGIVTYESILGANISIPSMIALKYNIK